MKIHKVMLTPAARKALGSAKTVGDQLHLGPPGSLPAETYKEVMKVLEVAGFKWVRGKKCHVKAGANAGQEIRDLLDEGGVVNEQKTYEFFPTASTVAAKMASTLVAMMTAPPKTFDKHPRILEPSAGEGALIRAVCSVPWGKYKPEIVAVELSQQRAAKIESDFGISVHLQDFLARTPNAGFDGVIMNPPFAGQADLKHVLHAWEFLRPGGILVALIWPNWTSSSTKIAKQFQELYSFHGKSCETLPAGVADDHMTTHTTDLIVLMKPLTPAQQAAHDDLCGTVKTKVPKVQRATTAERSAQTGQGAKITIKTRAKA